MENHDESFFEFEFQNQFEIESSVMDYTGFPKNVLPKVMTGAVLRIWQRLVVVRAACAVIERPREKNIDKYGDMKAAYEHNAALVVDLYKLLMPAGMTVEVLLQKTVNVKTPMTGKQPWDMWTTTNSAVVNDLLPAWHKHTRGGVPSGQQLDDVLFSFRQLMWDILKNEAFFEQAALVDYKTPGHESSSALQSSASSASAAAVENTFNDVLDDDSEDEAALSRKAAFFALADEEVAAAEEIRKTMGIYERLGLPGAIGSTDCVHIKWERCPVEVTNLCHGKEGYPTLAFLTKLQWIITSGF